jgi:Ca2+-dependent lipid-binding protein
MLPSQLKDNSLTALSRMLKSHYKFISISVDVPDPYVTVSIKTSPHGTQKTKHVDNDINPVWNETFKFYLNAEIDNDLGM